MPSTAPSLEVTVLGNPSLASLPLSSRAPARQMVVRLILGPCLEGARSREPAKPPPPPHTHTEPTTGVQSLVVAHARDHLGKPCTQCAHSAKFWMSPSTEGSIKQRMVQIAFGPVYKSLHTTCLKITHRVLILATGRSRGHTKDWTVTLDNGPSPSQPLRAQYALRTQCPRSEHAVQELPL